MTNQDTTQSRDYSEYELFVQFSGFCGENKFLALFITVKKIHLLITRFCSFE